ncbi:MAG: divalent-cation tolerance protein CutA [Treponema sp.]|nr:divalent-cation tolerance protein CutA [Treponema sp.]MCL2251903.1 divalent-cation tolerance protein CutA [Treponema sp.]
MEVTDKKYAMVITTCPSEKEAKEIAQMLLEKKLAACVQLFPINSYYIWKNEINSDNEITLFIKCNHSFYQKIEDAIKAVHSYEVPEIIMLPVIDGFKKYLGWIDEVSGD